MYENSSNELDPAPPIVLFYLMGIWAMITGITGFLANAIAIFLFVTTKKLRTPFNFILMNLSVTELIISCTGNSMLAINSFNRQWMFSSQMCEANAFGMTYLGIQSIITLAVLALQRFMMVTQDRQFPLSTNFSSLVTLIFIWLYTLSCAVPPIFGWGQFSKNTLKVSCGVKWAQADQNPVEHISFVAYIYMLGFVIPVIIIFTSYLKIIKTVNMNKVNLSSVSQNTWRGKLERDRRITRMVLIMLVSYLLLWFPYACVSIAEAAGYKPTSSAGYFLHSVPTMLTKANVCVDPFIYFGFNPQFQYAMKRRFAGKEEENSREMTSYPSPSLPQKEKRMKESFNNAVYI